MRHCRQKKIIRNNTCLMQDNNQFYTVMWKKNTQTYWQAGKPFKQQIKNLIFLLYIRWIKISQSAV
jgi:hypothetical protein